VCSSCKVKFPKVSDYVIKVTWHFIRTIGSDSILNLLDTPDTMA